MLVELEVLESVAKCAREPFSSGLYVLSSPRKVPEAAKSPSQTGFGRQLSFLRLPFSSNQERGSLHVGVHGQCV